MAQTSWPFENVDTSETQFSQWARNIGEGVKGVAGGTELKPYGDSSGMQVKVPAGQALVRGHYYNNDALVTLAVTAAHATLPRIDRVVLELDPTANTILLKVVAGTPNASPAAPALTQTDAGVYQVGLATIAVAAAATTIAAGNVTDTRGFIAPVAHTHTSAQITTVVTDKSANYSIVAADANTYIRSTGSAITITIDNVLSVGQRVDFIQDGSGQVTFTAGSGVTLASKDSLVKTAGQYAGATVVCVASGVYRLIGNLG